MYIPLRVNSPFSVGYGAVKTNELAEFCVKHKIPAAGIADMVTLSGVMANSKELRANMIQPLTGAVFLLDHSNAVGQVVFYAKSEEGYRALLGLANHVNTTGAGQAITTSVLADIIGDKASQIILLTGGIEGAAVAASKKGNVSGLLQDLQQIGFDLYVEIERNENRPGDAEADLIASAHAAGVPLVATSRAAYATPEMYDAHDTFLCIASKTYKTQNDRQKSARGLHLATPQEMSERFADIPNAVENTLHIARKANYMVEPTTPHTPAFDVPRGTSEEELLRMDASAGLKARLAKQVNANQKTYRDRLDYELDVIVKMGFPGYFLIVADFIGWARSQDIPVGPGRGSGAGSLVAYALGITDIDPLKFGLLFERFLNPERVSLPDFDIDFCQERREEVIAYVRHKYGKDKVALISAFGTLQARAVVKAVGRVMQVPYNQVDRYAKLIPKNPANPSTLADAMESELLAEALVDASSEIRSVFDTALKLEGLFSHVSTHAAGVIISDLPIDSVVPVHIDQHGNLATSFEMKAAEAAGLVKFDFLGLKNLDAIHGAKKFIKDTAGDEIDFDALDFSDVKTYSALAGGDGFAVFQLESAGMCRAMRDLRVETIDELIALISLYRPGPMEQIPAYAAVKAGEETAHYLHPEMEGVLSETNGVMIYQEQVMQIARSLAGYSLGDADLLRRAMGKKIQSEMDDQRKRFVEGAGSGWVEVETEDGTVRRMHALEKLPTSDGSGRTVTLQQALDDGIDVVIAA